MLRHGAFQLHILILKLTLYIDDRILEELVDGLPYNRTDILALFQLLHPVLHELLIVAELEVPVGNRLHSRSLACEGTYGVYEVLRHILMSHVTLVCIALFGSTAVYGTFSYYLSAVDENSCLLIKELHCSPLFQLSLFVK